jgi:uridine phosphorylase
MASFKASELVLNPDGSVYHLKAKGEQIADNVIVVGDPNRVEIISSYFDTIECKISNREINTHTGTYKGKRISVISTGMGPDNIDIVINELDAAVNIDLDKKEIKKEKRTLNIIRIGTSGALQKEAAVDSFVLSTHGLGIDGVMNFYHPETNIFEQDIENAFITQTDWPKALAKPYVVEASKFLIDKFKEGCMQGITITAPGFYGPQGRLLRIPLRYPDINEKLSTFSFRDKKILNYEMETSALYGIGKSLGHEMLTICVIIANRMAGEFSKNYKSSVIKLIEHVLNKI